MINFFEPKRSGNRISSTNPYPDTATFELDKEDAGRKGFMPNKKAIELLGLNCDRNENLLFKKVDQRIYVGVVSNDTLEEILKTEKAISAVVGKTGKANNKVAWELVTSIPTLNPGDHVKVVAVDEDTNDGVSGVFEIVAMTPEADNSPEAQEEAEQADAADVAVEEVEETTDNFGF